MLLVYGTSYDPRGYFRSQKRDGHLNAPSQVLTAVHRGPTGVTNEISLKTCSLLHGSQLRTQDRTVPTLTKQLFRYGTDPTIGLTSIKHDYY